MAKALVTGGAGFIGSHLSESLLAQGWEVTCLDNFSTGRRENVAHLPGMKIVEGDVNRAETWQALAGEKFDVLYHYAATVGVRLTEERPTQVLNDVTGINLVADFARAGGAGRVIFASSSEVYGEPREIPEAETDGIMGWSPYAVVKLYGENVCRALWQEDNIPTLSLRFFNVYGSRQAGSDYGFVVARFIDQVMAGESPTVFGDGSQTRDFVYVRDNIDAALAAVASEQAKGQVINVGAGHETSVLDLAETIIRVADKSGQVRPVFESARDVEITRRCALVNELKSVLGVECRTGLEDGIKMTVSQIEADMIRDHKVDQVPAFNQAG